jgi:hypothetical protein
MWTEEKEKENVCRPTPSRNNMLQDVTEIIKTLDSLYCKQMKPMSKFGEVVEKGIDFFFILENNHLPIFLKQKRNFSYSKFEMLCM